MDKNSYALALCRIEPENNIDMILEAYSKSELNLKFIGNWQANEYGRNLRHKYGDLDNIELIDPIYDLDVLCSIRKGCTHYIHGHSAGGTNPSLVEMMHFDVPIFAFDCNFNRYSTENKAFYFKTSESLLELLEMSTPNDLINNGASMREIAKRRYTWSAISSAYEAIYK
jgi:glycosyltransferase involved in cell wall biosynthesis